MQEIFVYAIVVGAAVYVGKAIWDAISGRKSGCNSCNAHCASREENSCKKSPASSAPAASLLQIELKEKDR